MMIRAIDFEAIEEEVVYDATLLDDSLLNAVHRECNFTAYDDVVDGLDRVEELFIFIYASH